MENEWFVYILECCDGSYYTGVTNDVEERMRAHQEGRGSKCVRAKGFLRLLRSCKCRDKVHAFKCEWEIKRLPREKKLAWFD